MHEDPMTVIVNDHGFAPEDTGAIAADLPSDFDPKGITAELLKQRSIRITLDSFADGRGFTLATRLRQKRLSRAPQARGPCAGRSIHYGAAFWVSMMSKFRKTWPRGSQNPNGWPAPTGAPMITNHACAAQTGASQH
jgi:hypothetical protein